MKKCFVCFFLYELCVCCCQNNKLVVAIALVDVLFRSFFSPSAFREVVDVTCDVCLLHEEVGYRSDVMNVWTYVRGQLFCKTNTDGRFDGTHR